ncbi:MAG: redoxin domain-containing protein [Anaerolineae bacterium]|nr:redoxin domain-containing protein [Anaerolineae bacterium]
MFCREWLAQLELHKDELTSAKLQIIGIAMGQPKHAERYCGKFAPSITCLTDETTLPYQTYGLQQGKLAELISPAVVFASVRALTRGSSQGETIGDAKMLPGTFIIDEHGIIRYAYYSKHAGDHPNITDLIAVANTLE